MKTCPDDCGRADWVYCMGCAHGADHPSQTAAWSHTVELTRLVVSSCGECGSKNSEIVDVSPAAENPEGYWEALPFFWEVCVDCRSQSRQYASEKLEVCIWRCQGACCQDYCGQE